MISLSNHSSKTEFELSQRAYKSQNLISVSEKDYSNKYEGKIFNSGQTSQWLRNAWLVLLLGTTCYIVVWHNHAQGVIIRLENTIKRVDGRVGKRLQGSYTGFMHRWVQYWHALPCSWKAACSSLAQVLQA